MKLQQKHRISIFPQLLLLLLLPNDVTKDVIGESTGLQLNQHFFPHKLFTPASLAMLQRESLAYNAIGCCIRTLQQRIFQGKRAEFDLVLSQRDLFHLKTKNIAEI